jgi:hypothetical protein
MNALTVPENPARPLQGSAEDLARVRIPERDNNANYLWRVKHNPIPGNFQAMPDDFDYESTSSGEDRHGTG